MSKNIKILFAAILIAGVFTQDKICEHFGFGQAKLHDSPVVTVHEKELIASDTVVKKDYFINDTIYRWDEQLLDWVMTKGSAGFRAQLVNATVSDRSSSKPIKVDWKVLLDIEYRLRYFSEIDMEMYAPVFPKAVEALHEKEVIIEGFVIPFDEEEELLSLSFNPYSSCFFCGKASPASVISMYLKKKRSRYKIDDFKKFRGTLYLNHDDPNEFYYILRNAKEV